MTSLFQVLQAQVDTSWLVSLLGLKQRAELNLRPGPFVASTTHISEAAAGA